MSTPKAGQPCKCCAHVQTAEISRAIGSGVSFGDISSRFGVTKASAARHAVNCLGIVRKDKAQQKGRRNEEQISAPTSSRFASAGPQELVAGTARLVDEALELLEHAKSAGDRRTALSALKEARDGLQLLMRAAGMLASEGAPTINIAIDNRRKAEAVLAGLSLDELRAIANGTTIEGEVISLPESPGF